MTSPHGKMLKICLTVSRKNSRSHQAEKKRARKFQGRLENAAQNGASLRVYGKLVHKRLDIHVLHAKLDFRARVEVRR